MTFEEPIVIFVCSIIDQFNAAVFLYEGNSEHVCVRVVA